MGHNQVSANFMALRPRSALFKPDFDINAYDWIGFDLGRHALQPTLGRNRLFRFFVLLLRQTMRL